MTKEGPIHPLEDSPPITSEDQLMEVLIDYFRQTIQSRIVDLPRWFQ